jgi:hypothetical protein
MPKGRPDDYISSTKMGIHYFKDYKDAHAWAKAAGWPTDRIMGRRVAASTGRSSGLRWAVQSKAGGHWAGPGQTPEKFTPQPLRPATQPQHERDAIDAGIRASERRGKKVGKKEARAIHGLLRGRKRM